ncbi:MAG: glutaminyl-peptide cyclotransferase [Pyrinomonadaceae bacterium]
MSRIVLILLLVVSLASLACRTGSNPNAATKGELAPPGVPTYGYEVVRTLPHDPNAFTQGLIFHDGKLLESTGGHNCSLRSVELQTGNVEKKVTVPDPYFAEGITLLNGKIYQLTWQHEKGFIYDASSFEKIGEFTYEGEGWGLANDGTSLILSDGTNRIRFLDPDNFQVRKAIAVFDARTPVNRINELEYVQGEIYANIWHDDRIARIDPQTGRVVGWVDLKGLLGPGEISDREAVLNGIAYDQQSQNLFVTGKLWPKLFEIRLKKK